MRENTPAGRRRRHATGYRLLLAAASTAAATLALVFLGCGRETRPPNLLLVTFDTTRADRIGCYGYGPAHTPHLDALAAEGILFEDALTAVPVTLPAHTTILSGQYPLRHGVRNNGSYRVRPETTTLAEMARDSGYQTAAFVSAFVLDSQFGISQGFDTYDDDFVSERSGPRTTERALSWLASRDDRPFFLWVHLFDPHTPWTPAAFGRSLPLPDDYDREIAVADHCLGQLLEALGPDRAHTTVAVLGDHGEGLDDHGEAEHGIFLYRETTRVPFLLALPGRRHAGLRVNEAVGTVDILPTLAGILGLPLPPAELDGTSLLGLIDGGAPPDRRGLYMESVYARENFGWAALSAFQSENWKWIDAPDPELYDLANDAAERTDLHRAEPERSRTLEDRLARFRALVGEPESPGPETMSPEVAERLRSLGYLSGGANPAEDEELPDPKSMISIHADFEEAKRAMDEGRFRDAIPHFRTVLARNPRNSTARLGLGTALVRVARFAEADTVLTQAIEVHPGNTTIQASLADALFGQLEFANALDIYRLAERDPSLGTRHVPSRIVLCLERTGRPTEADAALATYRGHPGDSEFWDDFRARIERDRELSDRIPANAEPRAFNDEDRIARALTSAGLGIITEAFRWLDDPMGDERFEQRRLELLTQLYLETRQPDRSLEALVARARMGPLAPPEQVRRADLLLALGRAEDALEAYRSLPESVPPVLRQLGVARCETGLGHPDAALRALRAALAAGWNDPESLFTDPTLRPLRSYAPFADLADSLTARSGS